MDIASPKRRFSHGSYCGGIGIVASAGGIPALIELLSRLNGTFPIPILVAQHLPRTFSNLDVILSRHCPLRVRWADADRLDDDLIGVTLAAPGTGIRMTGAGIAIDRLASPSTSWLLSGDLMIQSLLSMFGQRTVGIVLSGMLPAAIAGMKAITAAGGITMAQDRAAAYFEMPSAAIDFGRAEIVAPPSRMAEMLTVIAEDWRELYGSNASGM